MKEILKINKPCSEDWNKMHGNDQFRFCNSCQHEVVDFTTMSAEEIADYLNEVKGRKVCGRLREEQMNSPIQLDTVYLEGYRVKRKQRRVPIYVLALGVVIISSCQEQNELFITNGKVNYNQVTDSLEREVVEEEPDISMGILEEVLEEEILIMDYNEEMGDVAFGDIDFGYDVLPQFKGGQDSLYSFMKRNFVYPDWEKERGIEGRVIVQVTIDEQGAIKDCKIVRTVDKAKNFDNEVIRLMRLMPKWSPALRKELPISMEVNIPIVFKLKEDKD